MREAVRALPGMDRLLPALDPLAPAYLVGGAVRDLMLGEQSVDLDLAVEGDAPRAARELAERLGGHAVAHDRFGTATVRAPGLSVDVAATRRERYPEPGALPEVEPAGLEDDLRRRDFTINAMAVALLGDQLGRLHDPLGGRADLEAGTIRVLHSRSFFDDPTRLLRALRYEARFDFAMDADTEEQARRAAAERALDPVSGARVRDELMDLLAEPGAPRALERMNALGIDAALYESLHADPELAAGAQLAAGETGADAALAALAALWARAGREPDLLAERLQLTADERERAGRAAARARELARTLRTEELRPSELHRLLAPEPPEALALALAMGAPAEPVLEFCGGLRNVRLEITGADLLAAGVPESPAIGRALEKVFEQKLDGELSGREEELQAALAAVGAEGGHDA